MKNVKTAISIEKPLFQQIKNLAHEMNVSRSRVFSLAAKEFIQRHTNQELLDAINSAYDDVPDEKESTLKSVMVLSSCGFVFRLIFVLFLWLIVTCLLIVD